jgi:hypothetical protein
MGSRAERKSTVVPNPTTDRLNAALTWAAQGFWVFPCREKFPLTPHGFHDATRDPVLIAQWWREWPQANLAIDCERSNVVVVDVDVKKGAQGRTTIARFLERSPAFQETMLVATPSGGDHYWFSGQYSGPKHPFGPGVDCQGNGTYVLVPPSIAPSRYDEHGKPIKGSEAPYVVVRASALQPFPFEIVPTSAPANKAAAGLPEGWVSLEPPERTGPERDEIPYGEHRQSLWWLTWHLRSVHGLSVEAALPITRAFIDSGVLGGYNPHDPFSDKDMRTLLAGAKANIATQPPPSAALVDAIVPARTILLDKPPPRRHFIPGLIVQGKLHTFYGDSGIGKTTIVAYELAVMSCMGYDVLAFVNEDSPYDFATLFHLSGGDIDRLSIYKQNVRELLLPKDKGVLEQIVAARQWGAVYFDSILDIRSTGSRDNAANAARDLFAPVSDLAERYHFAAICTTHTNRAGTFEGSAQIRAKCRMFGKVERPRKVELSEPDANGMVTLGGHDPQWVTYVTNEKAQRGKQHTRYAFHFDTLPSRNPDGIVDKELDEYGNLVEIEQYVCVAHEEVENTSLPTEEKAPERVDLRPRIEALLKEEPPLSIEKMARRIGARTSAVSDIVRAIRGKS